MPWIGWSGMNRSIAGIDELEKSARQNIPFCETHVLGTTGNQLNVLILHSVKERVLCNDLFKSANHSDSFGALLGGTAKAAQPKAMIHPKSVQPRRMFNAVIQPVLGDHPKAATCYHLKSGHSE